MPYDGPMYAPSLASGGDKAKIVECRRCGREVALTKSKAGKWYTAQIYLIGQHHARKFAPWEPHFKHCQPARSPA